MKMLDWNVYEVTTKETSINGVMFRGRLRKLGLVNEVDILAENASDKDNCVRFALLDESKFDLFSEYILTVVPDSKIELVLEKVSNPVLSKLKVNIEGRYNL
jgi:hypothetical protein